MSRLHTSTILAVAAARWPGSCCLVLTAIWLRMRIQDMGPWRTSRVCCARHTAAATILKVSRWTTTGKKSSVPKEPKAGNISTACSQRTGLETFLEDGRLPLSNNLCEANIKPYATAKRAWLFANVPKGARANAILYTLSESARANELEVYEYLKYLLTECPSGTSRSDKSIPALVKRTARWMQIGTWT